MNRWKRYLQQSSRSRSFLWRFSLGLLALGVVLGYALDRWLPNSAASLQDRLLVSISRTSMLDSQSSEDVDLTPLVLVALAGELRDPAAEFEPVLDFMPNLAAWAPSASRSDITNLLGLRFPPGQVELGADVFAVCRTNDAAALERLKEAARAADPVRFAAHALGLAEFARGEMHAACAHFRREGSLPEAVGSRRKAVECLRVAKDYEGLDELKSLPEYAGLVPPTVVLSAAIERRDWPAILRAVPVSQFTGLDPAITALALIAGLAWAFVLGHLCEVPRLRCGLALLCALGFLAGVASTTPTIYAVIWQDDILGFSPAGDFIRTLVYYTGGVGVREELCKLALFVPFLPILIRRGDDLEALAVASFVGLGFAIEENGNYFLGSGGTSVAARFLTANFLHVALTGLNGLALFRACTRGMAGVNELLYVLGVTIIAHGLYDALFALPDPTLGSYLSLAVFVLTCQFYFHRANELRANARMLVSITGAFVAGISLLGCAMIAYQMTRLGPANGLNVVLPEFIATGVLLVLFFREFDERLAE